MKLDFLDFSRSLFSVSMLQSLGREDIMSQAELVFALNHLPISMMAFTVSGEILFYNQNFAVLFGLDDETEKLRHINELPFALNELKQCINEGVLKKSHAPEGELPTSVERNTFTLHFPKKNITRRIGFSIRAEKTLFKHGASYIWVLVASDITEQETENNALLELRSDEQEARKVASLNQQINIFARHLFEPVLAISQHHLLLSQRLEALKALVSQREAHADTPALLENIAQQEQHLAHMMHSLEQTRYLFHNLERLNQPVIPYLQPLNLNLKLRQWLREWEEQPFIPPHIALEVDSTLEVPSIRADLRQIQKCLRAILKNAVYSLENTEKPQIRLFLSLKERKAKNWYVCLHVVDNGKGFTPEIQEQLFNPFFTSQNDQMLGLGLPFVHKVMEAHHGFVQLKSLGEGQGTEVILSLPQTPENV